MIYITGNNDSGLIHTNKNYHSGTPESTERSYTVTPCACFYEVRCVTREKGRVTGNQLVAALPSEQEAEAMARDLADPVKVKDRGRRTLEQIIEEDW